MINHCEWIRTEDTLRERDKDIIKGKIGTGQVFVSGTFTLINCGGLEDFQCSEAASTLNKLHGLL